MSDKSDITEIVVEWGPYMASCTLRIYRGANCKEGVSIRPNVRPLERQPEGWQRKFDHLRDGTRMSLNQARGALLALGLPEWEDTVHFALGNCELRGQAESLKFWLTCHSPAGMKTPTPDQVEQMTTHLFALRHEIWG